MKRLARIVFLLTILALSAHVVSAQQPAISPPVAQETQKDIDQAAAHFYLWKRYKQVNRHLEDPDSLDFGDTLYIPNPRGNEVIRTDSLVIARAYPEGLWGIAKMHYAALQNSRTPTVTVQDSLGTNSNRAEGAGTDTVSSKSTDTPSPDDLSLLQWLAIIAFGLIVFGIPAAAWWNNNWNKIDSVVDTEDGSGVEKPVTDSHPTLSHHPFRAGGYDPDFVDDDLRHLAEEHHNFSDPDIGERTRGVLRTEGPVVLDRYDRFGNALEPDELSAGAELTVVRGTARDGHEDIDYVFAVVQCMNQITVPDGDFLFTPQDELVEEIEL